MYCIMFESQGHLCLDATEENGGLAITGFDSEYDAMMLFEKPYNDAQRRGGTWEVSAVLHWAFFSPKVIQVSGVDEIREKIVGETLTMVKARNVAGFMQGVQCNGPEARKFFDSGRSPKPLAG